MSVLTASRDVATCSWFCSAASGSNNRTGSSASTGVTAGDGSAGVSGCWVWDLAVSPLALAAEAPAAPLPDDAEAEELAASLPFLPRDLLVALRALDAFCISCLGDTADHRVVEDADAAAAGALALSLGVMGRSPPSACAAGALSADRLAVAAVPLVLLEEEDEGEGDANEEEEEELCSDELTVGRRNDGTGLSDAGAAAASDERPVDARDGSELRGLDGGLPVPLLLLGRVPSLDRSDGRVAMGACLCIAKRSGRICQLYLQEFTR